MDTPDYVIYRLREVCRNNHQCDARLKKEEEEYKAAVKKSIELHDAYLSSKMDEQYYAIRCMLLRGETEQNELVELLHTHNYYAETIGWILLQDLLANDPDYADMGKGAAYVLRKAGYQIHDGVFCYNFFLDSCPTRLENLNNDAVQTYLKTHTKEDLNKILFPPREDDDEDEDEDEDE